MVKITAKITLWYVATFSVIVAVTSIFIYNIIKQNHYLQIDRELSSIGNLLFQQAISDTALKSESLLNAIISKELKASRKLQNLKFFLGEKDSIVYENSLSEPISYQLDSLSNYRDSAIGNKKTIFSINFADTTYRVMFYPFETKDKLGDYFIGIVASTHEIELELTDIKRIFFIMVPFLLLLSAFGGWFIADRAMSPVRDIIFIADKITSSELSHRVPIPRIAVQDELKNLVRTFNKMISKLEKVFTSQRRFIADASHDFKTPLTVIQCELESITAQNKLSSSITQSINISLNQVNKLNQLSSDLLLLARADTGELSLHKEEHRIDEIILDAIASLNKKAVQKSVQIKFNFTQEIIIQADNLLLTRAFINILSNSINYSSTSEPFIDISILDTDNLYSQVVINNINLNKWYFKIIIQDNGIGVSPQELEKIFDRFYRAENSRNKEGSGLGLAIAKSILEAHGGSVSISSTLNSGTKVTVVLPFLSKNTT